MIIFSVIARSSNDEVMPPADSPKADNPLAMQVKLYIKICLYNNGIATSRDSGLAMTEMRIDLNLCFNVKMFVCLNVFTLDFISKQC